MGLFVPACGSASLTWHVLRNPIDAAQLTEMPWGSSSYWLQPWRSSLVTRPATSLQNAIGINFDVKPQEAMATARLLHENGFRRARLEINWNQMSYSNPWHLANTATWRKYITAMRAYGLRPLILVNASPGGPTPMLSLNLSLRDPAPAGTTRVSLDSASADNVVPGLTGINVNGYAGRALITSVNSRGDATLSQPLSVSLPAGPVAASTFKYAPFAPPLLAGGQPNPRYQDTLAGWLSYVRSVGHFVTRIYGSDNFDLEVWNENQAFLNESDYFNPLPDPGSTGNTAYAVLQATIQMLRDPVNGLTDVQVGDGFSNQSPWTSGTTVPPGTNAIDHHPYKNPVNIDPGSPTAEAGIQSVNALGLPARAASGVVRSIFTPRFRAFFPEYYLSGIQTETLMRDLSPTIQSDIYGVLHGAGTHPAGTVAPATWITEDNLDHIQAITADRLPAADLPEMQAKAALRFYVSFAAEGTQAIDLFAAAGGPCCQIIPQAFFDAVDKDPGSYPATLGGRTMRAVARMTSTLSGAQPIAQAQQLTLNAVAQYGNHSQFKGNGTVAYPNLYDRNVLAFFPFQVSQNRLVVAVYLMTRDLTHRYTSQPAPGQTPYDLPPEQFRLTIGNVNGATAAVSLYDPLTGMQQPATIVSRASSEIVVQLGATDSPRMLTINSNSAATVSP